MRSVKLMGRMNGSRTRRSQSPAPRTTPQTAAAGHEPAHRSTRSSSGRAPIRSMTAVGDEGDRQPAQQHGRSDRRVVGRDGFRPARQQHQDDPRRGDREPRRVDRPGLPGFQLAAGAGALPQEFASVPSSRPRSEPPTSRVSRRASTIRSATGSARRSFSLFSDGSNWPPAR